MWKGRNLLVRRSSRKRIGQSRRIRVPNRIRQQPRVMSITRSIRSEFVIR
jgi:hypothetical protein